MGVTVIKSYELSISYIPSNDRESLNCAHTQMAKYPSGYNAASETGHPIPCENMQVLSTSSLTVVFAVSTG